MNHTCLCLPSRSWYLFTDYGRLSWPWVAGWLHTEINVWHVELNPDTVAHLSTNWAQRWLTSLIEANALATMADRQPDRYKNSFCKHNWLTKTLLISLPSKQKANIITISLTMGQFKWQLKHFNWESTDHGTSWLLAYFHIFLTYVLTNVKD